MKVLKFVSVLLLLCGVLSLTGCLGDGGNTLSVYSTGSIYKTTTGDIYMYIDRTGLSVTSAELQSEDFSEGDRLLASSTIDFDNQGVQLSEYIYNATISGIHKFDCNNFVPDNTITTFVSDTLPVLYVIDPFINLRKNDDIVTFGYTKYDTESDNPGSLKLVQPKPYDYEAQTDTLYLVYEKGNIKDTRSSDYVSFKLPQYPVNTDINLVIRYQAESSNISATGKDKISPYISITYNRPENLE